MLLTARIIGTKKAFIDEDFPWDQLGADAPVKVEAAVSAGYTDISSPRNWRNFHSYVGIDEPGVRDELVAFNGSWASLSDDDKKAMVETFVYPSTVTETDLNAIHPAADRAGMKSRLLEQVAINHAKTTVENVLTPAATAESTPAGGYEELGRTTLTAAGDMLSVPNLPVRKYLHIIAHLIPSGGDIDTALRFNNDSANNYSGRFDDNGAEGQLVNTTGVSLEVGTFNEDYLAILDVVNVAAREKLVTGLVSRSGGTGAAAVPTRRTIAGKWANMAAAITRVDIVQLAATRDFAAGSELVVFGRD